MNVLSLFDGISCGQVALERAGIKAENYFASEIEESAIEITTKNYPNTIQLGDVNNHDKWDLPKIDLLIGGSPCQDISHLKQGANGLNGDKSSLFYQYLKTLEEVNPKYFLLENVVGRKDAINEITRLIGVEPILIDSKLLSGQKRRRYYWTNIPDVTQPKNKGIKLVDILQPLEEVQDCILNEGRLK